jgi:hypothetical protein
MRGQVGTFHPGKEELKIWIMIKTPLTEHVFNL